MFPKLFSETLAWMIFLVWLGVWVRSLLPSLSTPAWLYLVFAAGLAVSTVNLMRFYR